MARIKGSSKTGGRKRGAKNKATKDIKELLDSTIDFSIVVKKLFELTKGVQVRKKTKEADIIYDQPPDAFAAKILLEYRFGKPAQSIELKGEVDTHITFSETIISKKV